MNRTDTTIFHVLINELPEESDKNDHIKRSPLITKSSLGNSPEKIPNSSPPTYNFENIKKSALGSEWLRGSNVTCKERAPSIDTVDVTLTPWGYLGIIQTNKKKQVIVDREKEVDNRDDIIVLTDVGSLQQLLVSTILNRLREQNSAGSSLLEQRRSLQLPF